MKALLCPTSLFPMGVSRQRLTSLLAKYTKYLLLVACALFSVQTRAVNLTALPPYLTEIKGAPMIMLNLSRDHQLFYKAYNEYSDLDGDGVVETQYKHSYKYYGYFDNQRCYTYDTANNRYVPARKVDATGYCNYTGGTLEWSGNFMNWGTMTRMDVVRRILYGGTRSTDTSITSGVSQTVLERAHVTTDAHAFAKYYVGTDINKLTPFVNASITLCNASFSNTAAPSILVASGNHSLWNANERWQCYWSEDKSASNGNNPAVTGFNASSSNPSRVTNGLGVGYAQGSFTARVEVCKTGLPGGFTSDEDSRCKLYPLGNYKPVGLLQKYGERNEAAFGLMTGSYDKNISGGVLRKNVASFTDEVDIDDGQFTTATGIVTAMNKLKIYSYDYGDGTHQGLAGKCNFQQIGLVDGECASWGNPLGEIYLESLRYFAGAAPTAAFNASPRTIDNSLGLTVTAWSDPFATSTVATFGDRLCRRNSVINFNASVTSFDNDQWGGVSSIAGMSTTPSSVNSVENYTNQIGAAEDLYAAGKLWSVGRNGVDNNGFCSDKTITATGASAFANVTGICPEAPTQFGGYKMAGAALYAHTKPVRNDYAIPTANKRAFKIDTYSVALATGTPRIKIPVPRQPGKFIFISPSYRLDLGAGGQGGGTLVDFKVISQNATSGSYLINWEDSEQGGDFDQDVLGLLSYSVNTTTSVISVTTYAAAQATANGQGFGYSISGTSGKDGVHFHSGILGFNYTDSRNIAVTPTTNVNASGGCNDCQVAQTASTGTYTMVGVTADSLKDPLWYAAKYGGFNTDITATYSLGAPLPLAAWDSKGTDGSVGADGIPDNYFLAVDPAQLEASLSSIFSTILKSGGAAPAATSAQTQAGGYAYQSTFSVKPSSTSPAADADASGQFLRFSILSSGLASTVPDFDAGARVTIQNWNTGRNILSLSSAGQIPFRWASLDSVQKLVLRVNPKTGASSAITVGQNRLEWLRGNSTQETTAGGLRKRPTTKLGAIINSTPWFVGPPSAGYTNSAYGGGYNTFRTTNTATNAVFVAANDGMLHAFNGATGDELFAYVPRAMYTTATTAPFAKLSGITDKDFALNVGTAGMTVDGSVMAADMKVGGSWSTYLFGTFGRGAKGVYALDVTRPQNVTEASTSVVKWEFSEATGDPDMGYIVGRATPRSNGQPFQTGYMANGKWAAIYGNGYNSTSGKAALFILFADGPGSASATAWTTGTHYIKIPVGAAGLDNGLATPTAVDSNNDGVIDYIYAGDLKGQVWKFDVRNTNPAMWASATGSVPLYQAQTTLTGTSTVVVQPITTVVQPYPHPKGGYQLLFATGKSLENTDFPSAVPFVNRIYGIYDKPGTTTTLTVGLTDLVAKTATVIASVPYLVTATVDYTTQKGWYINLPQGSESALFNQIAFDSNLAALRTLFTNGVSDGCRIDTSSADWTFNPVSGIPPDNLIPGAPTVNGYKAAGSITANSYEVGRGGVYRKATPPPSTTVCTAGDPNCVCNPAAATQCVLCLDAATCNPPWAPLEANQCVFRTFGAGGDGNPDTTLRYGKCTDGRLTWREIFRNR